MAINTVTLTWDVTNFLQASQLVAINIAPDTTLTDPTNELVVADVSYSQEAYGAGTIAGIVACDNGQILPSGWAYVITVSIGNTVILDETVQINFASGATQDLSSLVELNPAPALLASLPLPTGTPAVGQVPTVVTAGSPYTAFQTPATAPVTSVFGRSGAVLAQTGDYTAAQVGADASGAAAAAAAASLPAYVLPSLSQLGILAQNYSNLTANQASAALTSGVIYLCRINLSGASITITNVLLGVYTAGATLTTNECFCGLFDNNGNEIGISANQSTIWTSAGLKTAALVSGPFTGTWPFVDVAIVSNGTTNPAFARAAGGGVGASMAILNSTGANMPFAVNGTGATVLPSSFTYSSNSSANNPQSIWCGVS